MGFFPLNIIFHNSLILKSSAALRCRGTEGGRERRQRGGEGEGGEEGGTDEKDVWEFKGKWQEEQKIRGNSEGSDGRERGFASVNNTSPLTHASV